MAQLHGIKVDFTENDIRCIKAALGEMSGQDYESVGVPIHVRKDSNHLYNLFVAMVDLLDQAKENNG